MDKYAIFKIGREEFGVNISRVVEILKAQKFYTLPQLPDFLSGVINVRGEVIPMLDLRMRFSINASAEQNGFSRRKERIIIVRFDQDKLGLLIDEIREIIPIAPEDISPPPQLFKGLKTEYLAGLGKKGEKIIILLNLDTLLTSEEKILLKETAELEEEQNAGH